MNPAVKVISNTVAATNVSRVTGCVVVEQDCCPARDYGAKEKKANSDEKPFTNCRKSLSSVSKRMTWAEIEPSIRG